MFGVRLHPTGVEILSACKICMALMRHKMGFEGYPRLPLAHSLVAYFLGLVTRLTVQSCDIELSYESDVLLRFHNVLPIRP